jgi:membrane protein YdbS with pleckstrin-like domain
MIPDTSNYCRFCGAPQHGPEAAAFQIQAPTLEHFDAPSFVIQHAGEPDDKPSDKPSHDKHDKKEHTQHDDKDKNIIENQRLAGSARLIFFFSYMARTFPILLGLLIGVWFDPLVFGIILASFLFLLMLIAFAVHDSFRYSVDEHSFEKEFGIIHTQQVTIPFSHIENVNIVRTTADMLLGLARIDIETAGSAASTPRHVVGGSVSKAEAHLPGVTLDQAKKIHDLVLQKMDRIKK